MLAKVVVLAALVAVVSASIPITRLTRPISLPQRLAAIRGTISHSECVPCEEAMGTAIHTGAEAGQQIASDDALFIVCNNALPTLSQFVSGWMGEWMFKICPSLNEKYATAPFLQYVFVTFGQVWLERRAVRHCRLPYHDRRWRSPAA